MKRQNRTTTNNDSQRADAFYEAAAFKARVSVSAGAEGVSDAAIGTKLKAVAGYKVGTALIDFYL